MSKRPPPKPKKSSAPYAYHIHALGREVASSKLLNLRMLNALSMAARIWPGKFFVAAVRQWDADRVEMKLVFTLKEDLPDWDGHHFEQNLLDCCPESHVEEALRAATAHFFGIGDKGWGAHPGYDKEPNV